MSAASFPTRLIRSFFGPQLEDAKPVVNKFLQIPAAAFNAAFWQIAGCNLVLPRVQVIAEWTGSLFEYRLRTEAWNAENDQEHPTLARVSAGIYTLTFAATYLDGNGNAVQPDIKGARVDGVGVQAAFADRKVGRAWVDPADQNLVHVRLWDSSGTLVDTPFWLGAS